MMFRFILKHANEILVVRFMYNKGTCSGEGCVFSFVDLYGFDRVRFDRVRFYGFDVSDHASDIYVSDQLIQFVRFGSEIELTLRFICSKMKYR